MKQAKPFEPNRAAWKAYFVVCLLTSIFANTCNAESSPRRWTSGNGSFTTEAVLERIEGSPVFLNRVDNKKTIKVSVESLCEADRQYINEQSKLLTRNKAGTARSKGLLSRLSAKVDLDLVNQPLSIVLEQKLGLPIHIIDDDFAHEGIDFHSRITARHQGNLTDFLDVTLPPLKLDWEIRVWS